MNHPGLFLLLLIGLTSAYAQPVHVQSKVQGFPAGTFVQVELDAIPAEGNLLMAFLGSPTDSSNHFFPTESGWTFLTDEISNARLHVFYKFAGASENKKKTFLTPHLNSNYTAIVAEYVNAVSIAGFVTNSSEDAVNSLQFDPVNTRAGQRAVAAFAARQLSTDAIVWSDGFEARASVTVDPEGSPLGSAMSDFMVTTDSEIQTTASWAPLAEPGGILLLLSEELITYDASFNIRDEADETLSGAIVTFNGVRKEAGEYTVTGIRSGTYDYMVEKEGYLTYKGRITVVEDGTEDVLLYALTPGKYYVSADGNDSNPGNTPRAPWKTINKALYFTFQNGDDVYLRCGDTFTPSDYWNIGWEGTAEDPVVIGAYYMEGEIAVHSVNEEGRPIVSGNNFNVPRNTCFSSIDQYRGLISVRSKDHIHLKDLHILKSGFYGISVEGDIISGTNSAYFLIQNLRIEEAFRAGVYVGVNYINYGIIEDCEISGPENGLGIECNRESNGITVAHCPFSNMLIRNNLIYEISGRGITSWTSSNALYKNHGHLVIEDNVIWNTRINDIYVEKSENVNVRRNMCMGAGPDVQNNGFFLTYAEGRGWNDKGIWVNCDASGDETGQTSSYLRDIQISNNLIANHRMGMGIASAHETGERIMKNIYFANNTLISNYYNISVGEKLSGYTMENVEFKNNISFCPPGDISLDTETEQSWWATKIIWDYNAWSSPRVFAKGNNDIVIDPYFVKTTGWQDLTHIASAENFSLSSGSNAIDAGTPLPVLFTTDYFLTERPLGLAWDIGAIEYTPVVQVKFPVNPVELVNLYPNPSSGKLNIEFILSEPGDVIIMIYDITGKEVTELLYQQMLPGRHQKFFELHGMAEGLYLLRLQAGKRDQTIRMILQ